MAVVLSLALGMALGLVGFAAHGDGLAMPDERLFPVPENLEPNLDFWTGIFARYTSDEAVLHDEEQVDIVYAVLDFSQVSSSNLSEVQKRRRRQDAAERAKDRYRSVLLDLANGRAPSAPDDARRVQDLFQDVPGGTAKYKSAADRLRTQTGLKNTFSEAIERSGKYIRTFERTFGDRDMPLTLTRLPFVESMFQEGARSKVAAGGMWQIMPATGRGLLRISSEVDERFDPFRASEAAATLLNDNHKALGTWPLAVTAYNYGRNGLRRAVKNLGTRDIGVILDRHQSRTFGFAVKNFYASFLASVKVYENRDHFFPGVSPASPLVFEEFVADRYVSPLKLAAETGVPVDDLKSLNPALANTVWKGELLVPAGYRLRVPGGQLEGFRAAYASLPAKDKPSNQIGTRYRVRTGDTLSSIAARYGTSVSALQRANNLRRANLIRAGQVLRIPGAGGTVRSSSASQGPKFHVVRRGESLGKIAGRYGTSVRAILRLNRISNANRIYPGQRLRIP